MRFKNNDGILYRDYLSNNDVLNSLKSDMNEREVLYKGMYSKVRLTSYVSPSDTSFLESINKVSVQGSVVRAYLMLNYKINYSKFIFQIDTSSININSVKIEFLDYKEIEQSSGNIHYTLNISEPNLKLIYLKYKKTQFKWREKDIQYQPVSALNFIDTNNISRALVVKNEPIKIKDSISVKKPVEILAKKKVIEVETILPSTNMPSVQSEKKWINYVAIKTNLAGLYGYTLSNLDGLISDSYIPVKERPIVNLSLEFSLNSLYSLSAEVQYSNFPKNIENSWWKMSSISLDFYRRSNNKNHKTSFYIGPHISVGDFDIYDNSSGSIGYTGFNYSCGISTGLRVPVIRNLCFEIVANLGYQIVKYDSYTKSDFEYFLSDSFVSKSVRVTDIKFNIAYIIPFRRLNK